MKKLLKLILSIFSKVDKNKIIRLKIIDFINKVKTAVNNPVADLIVEAIPGVTDDMALECIRKWIPVILRSIGLSSNALNASEAVNQAVITLNALPMDDRTKYYKNLGGELYTSFTGIPLDTAIEDIQKEYRATA